MGLPRSAEVLESAPAVRRTIVLTEPHHLGSPMRMPRGIGYRRTTARA